MKNYLFLFFIPLLWAGSCNDDDRTTEQPTEPSYESCCGTSPVTFTVGEGKVYVPNVFTNNGDGINDLFLPFANGHVTKIEDFTITGEGGETLYSIANFDPGDFSDSWKGTTVNDTTFHKGPFTYKMKVTDDTGQSATIEGAACSIRCDSAAVIFQTKEGCFFATQYDGEGGFDASFPSFEEDCFGG